MIKSVWSPNSKVENQSEVKFNMYQIHDNVYGIIINETDKNMNRWEFN